jgi:tRNA A37 threonylcarbamoyladenosine dehydratase
VTLDNVDDILKQHMVPNDNPCIVLDAIDSMVDKVALLSTCVHKYHNHLAIVTVGGAAGYTDPTCIRIEDMARTKDDRLLFQCRKELRKPPHNFKKSNLSHPKRRAKIWNIPAVYSTEILVPQKQQQKSSSLRTCDSYLGTACHVTGTFGFVAASRIVEMIATNNIAYPTALAKSAPSNSKQSTPK